MKVLVDSDIWMDFFKNITYATETITKLSSEGRTTSSILTITELSAGWAKEEALKRLPRFYKLAEILPVTEEVAELAGHFIKQYSTKGLSLPTVDTIIGVTSIINGCELATRNKKDFPMPEIKFYDF